MRDINELVNIASKVNGKVQLVDGSDFRVNAKSLIGALASMEWDNLYIESEQEISGKIQKFIVND